MLSDENIKKLVFTGIYEADPAALKQYEKVDENNPWTQRYEYWVPVRLTKGDKNVYYMINTYQIEPRLYFPEPGAMFKALVKQLEWHDKDGGAMAYYKTGDYYYRAVTKLNDKNIKLFKLVADLKEYEYIPEEKAGNYKESDVIRGVRLCREHNHSKGVCIVRTDAKEDVVCELFNCIEKYMSMCKAPSAPHAACEEVLKLAKKAELEGANYSVEKVLCYLNYLHQMKELEESYYHVLAELNRRLESCND